MDLRRKELHLQANSSSRRHSRRKLSSKIDISFQPRTLHTAARAHGREEEKEEVVREGKEVCKTLDAGTYTAPSYVIRGQKEPGEISRGGEVELHAHPNVNGVGDIPQIAVAVQVYKIHGVGEEESEVRLPLDGKGDGKGKKRKEREKPEEEEEEEESEKKMKCRTGTTGETMKWVHVWQEVAEEKKRERLIPRASRDPRRRARKSADCAR